MTGTGPEACTLPMGCFGRGGHVLVSPDRDPAEYVVGNRFGDQRMIVRVVSVVPAG